MTQESGMNHDVDGFENAPNMVPGEVEAAEQLDPAVGVPRKTNRKTQLFFALAGLLFAGGWGYAHQQEFKTALGYQTRSQSNFAVTGTEFESCAAGMMAIQNGKCQGTCPLAAAEKLAAAGNAGCCDKGRKNAMVAALLNGIEEKTETTVDSAEEKSSSEKENASQEKTSSEPSETQTKEPDAAPVEKDAKSDSDSVE